MYQIHQPGPNRDERRRGIPHHEVYCKWTSRIWCLKCRLMKLRNPASEKEWKAGCKWK